ncbi:hypothetical protein G9A89_005880 [Geosiphon pyriformis]|nr:hypothetical protein G9A89_005880 [Geosiphon pyriformis]
MIRNLYLPTIQTQNTRITFIIKTLPNCYGKPIVQSLYEIGIRISNAPTGKVCGHVQHPKQLNYPKTSKQSATLVYTPELKQWPATSPKGGQTTKKCNRKLEPFRNWATRVQFLLLLKDVLVEDISMMITKLIHKGNVIMLEGRQEFEKQRFTQNSRHRHPIMKPKKASQRATQE